MRPFRALTALALVILVGAAVPSTSAAQPTAVTVIAGSATPINGFLLQTSAQISDDAAVTKPGFPTGGWMPIGPRSTVFAGLLQNGRYPDPFFSTNMKNVDRTQFNVPWWYRAELQLESTTERTYLDFSGVLSRADVWVNGTLVATKAQVAGAYTRHDLDITAHVRTGSNLVAFKVYPNDPNRDLTMGWIDWAQTPPDQNMGLVRDIVVRRSGPVALRGARVLTNLAMPSLNHADLTVKADVRNDSANAVQTVVAGTVAGVPITQTVSLAAREKKTITFGAVGLDNPNVWWPAGMGGQHLYELSLTASVAGTTSDSARTNFGVRDVKAPLNSSGGRAYSVNGRPLLVRGGGWSPDLFLRWDAKYAEDKLKYVLDLGLNTVRLEGHIEPDDFFDMADRLGVLTMPGWECCDKWEGHVNGSESGDTWVAEDYVIAKASMVGEAARLRNHPSVISFHIGSDFPPDATIERNYLDALRAEDWPTPVIPVASNKSSPQLGSSGMKMNGPYDWVPPGYWYDKAHTSGGAYSFNSETSAGPDIPTMDTLQRMMTAAELDVLWKNPNASQYHRSSSSTFGNLRIFGNALSGRYGAPTSLDDYVRKAQLAQYENVRAEFESHARNFTDSSNPSTGLIYWMLNSPWTSLHWQLFDAYLDQNGAYYGAKKANEPLHIQYSNDTKSVVVINQNHATANGLTATAKVYNTDGTQKFSQTQAVSVPGDGGKTTALTLPAITGLTTTYLVKLTLTDSTGQEVSRNVYWLSTQPDTIDWNKSQWYYTPTKTYADLSGLKNLPAATISTQASTTNAADGTTTTTVTLQNTSTGTAPAFYVDAHIVGTGGKPVLPIDWTDNAVSLWPGESTTIKATYRTSDLAGASPSVRVSGWNTGTQTVPGNGGGGPGPSPVVYEAEDGVISQGAVESNHAGFTGRGFVNLDNVTGSALEWTVNATTAGPADVVLRYANGTMVSRPMDVLVNGVSAAQAVAFGGTGAWSSWQTKAVRLNLVAGSNKIKVVATTANGGPNLDSLTR
ncbi:hypothetical protein OG394_13695 [Kribbella sp. NBC_01245]|uniref:glycosyl hydrolase 2 galactose-binding domain-containing protein n=1 Tax=Kribbella sp. NBC_01245 TaxID=2903578 RepID=UPI002E2AF3EF|nr:CBM35 domain-containing protein [Kribbella sp. NBC_01245]